MTNETEAVRAEPVAWMTWESHYRLTNGGNDSRGTVPVHAKKSNVSKIPVYPPSAIAHLQARVEALESALRLIERNSVKADWPDDIWEAITSALTQPEADHG